MNFNSLLDEQQKKYVFDFKQKKTEELKMMLENETWTHSPVSPYF